jgi:CelD/BcsL family acetyltransferase involved in cellulose biosynthesis
MFLEPLMLDDSCYVGSEEAAVTLSIQDESPASIEQWQRAWAACEHATFFQSPEWAQVWEEYSAGRVRPAAKIFRFSDGREAILPLCFEHKLGGLLNRYVASPEATYGGWVSAEPLTTGHAVLLTQWLLASEGTNLVWRLNPYDPLALAAAQICHISAQRDFTHSIRLDADPETLLRGFKKGCREDIRKAQKRGHIEVTPATTVEEWRAYFRVYQDSLTRWGLGPNGGYRWELFDTLRRRESPHVRLWVARYEGQIVSGELSFYSRQQSVSWHAATLKNYLRSGVGKLQSFEIMKDCCARGFAWLDFNPSAGLGGVKELKESFRAQALPAPLVYVDTRVKKLIRRAAALFDVQDAKIDVAPLDGWPGEIEPPSAPESLPPPPSRAMPHNLSA